MKVIRVSEETHKYFALQRALTGVPAGKQVEEMVREKKNEENADYRTTRMDGKKPQI